MYNYSSLNWLASVFTSLFLNIGFVFFTTSVIAQSKIEYALLAVPDSLMKNAHTIIRNEKQVFRIKSEKEGVLERKKVVTLVNSNSNANRIRVYYDDETKVSKLKVNLYDKFGQFIRKAKTSEIQDLSAVQDFSIYQDDRFLYLEVVHNDYPYTIELEYEVNLKGIRFGIFPTWFIQGYNETVENSAFTITIPKEQEFYYQALNSNLEPHISEDNNLKIYHWQAKNLIAVQEEPYSPSPYTILPIILFSPDIFQIDRYRGSMADWKSYGAFVYDLYKDKDDLPESVVKEVKALIQPSMSDREKIQVLYNYLQSKNRYVSVQLGIGGWEPFDAEYVAKNQYGDCKALTNYMKALLNTVDIDAYPALIKNGDLYYEVNESFTTSSFNHVILYVPEGDYWLECTSSDYPINYIGNSNSNRNVLLVTEDGGALMKTPAYGAETNKINRITDFVLKEDGTATVAINSKMKGSEHELYRYLAHKVSAEKQREWYIEKSKLPTLELESLKITASEDQPISNLNAAIKLRQYGTSMGKRIFLPLNLLSSSVPVFPKTENRKYLVELENGYTHKDEINFELPEHYQVESLPDGIELKTEFASFSYKITETERKIQLTRELTVKSGQWPASKYQEIGNFFSKVAKSDQLKAVLRKN